MFVYLDLGERQRRRRAALIGIFANHRASLISMHRGPIWPQAGPEPALQLLECGHPAASRARTMKIAFRPRDALLTWPQFFIGPRRAVGQKQSQPRLALCQLPLARARPLIDQIRHERMNEVIKLKVAYFAPHERRPDRSIKVKCTPIALSVPPKTNKARAPISLRHPERTSRRASERERERS